MTKMDKSHLTIIIRGDYKIWYYIKLLRDCALCEFSLSALT